MTTNQIYQAILSEQKSRSRRRDIQACILGATLGLLTVACIHWFGFF